MRTLGGLTAISSTNETAPTPAQVTASPAFTGGTGTQADPYLITNVGSPFSGASLTSEHEITISGTAGDIAVFTDNRTQQHLQIDLKGRMLVFLMLLESSNSI